MSFARLEPRTRRLLVAIWLAGGVALLATMAFSVVLTTPYRTTWAWISFIAMVALEDVVAGRSSLSYGWRMPRVTLLAAIIVFRKHPDVAVLVALAAALLANLVMRQAWFTLLGKASSWVVAVGLGSAVLGLVGYGDMAHFVVATAILPLAYAILTRLLGRLLEGADPAAVRPLASALAFGALGAAVALGWRTPSVGPLMLRLAEVCVLAMVGVLIGFALGGTARGWEASRISVRRTPAVVLIGRALLAVSTRLPNALSAIVAAAALLAIGLWALRRRAYHAACLVLGGLSNEVVRMVNGGRMPVEASGLPPDLQSDFANLTRDSSAYLLVSPGTRLPWLADRFPVPIFPGVASLGDILVAIGIVWLAAALTVARPAITPGVEVPGATTAA